VNHAIFLGADEDRYAAVLAQAACHLDACPAHAGPHQRYGAGDAGASHRKPPQLSRVLPSKEVTGMRYRLEVRVTAADVGQRVTIRWRPAELDGSRLMTDVLGILEDADDQFFKVRRGRDGQLVVIPRERALAGKVVPPAPPPRRPPKAPTTS
jgi:hypothetical protein